MKPGNVYEENIIGEKNYLRKRTYFITWVMIQWALVKWAFCNQ